LGIATSKLFDQKFEDFLFRITLKESGIQANSTEASFLASQVNIQQRKIVAQINNGWRDLQDTEISASLG